LEEDPRYFLASKDQEECQNTHSAALKYAEYLRKMMGNLPSDSDTSLGPTLWSVLLSHSFVALLVQQLAADWGTENAANSSNIHSLI
jgi:hypothetical protein